MFVIQKPVFGKSTRENCNDKQIHVYEINTHIATSKYFAMKIRNTHDNNYVNTREFNTLYEDSAEFKHSIDIIFSNL